MKPAPRFCPNCGAKRRRPDARFCQNCGHAFASVNVPPPSPRPSPKKKSRLPLLIGIFLAVAALIIIAGGFTFEHLRSFRQGMQSTGLVETRMPETSPTASVSQPSIKTATTAVQTDTPAPGATVTQKPTDTRVATATHSPTFTPVPTNTSTPTPTPTPIPSAIVQKTAWLRSGPSTQYERIRKLGAGEVLTLVGRNTGADWFKVITGSGETGWVYGQLLRVSYAVDLPVIATLPPPPDPGRVVFASSMNGFAHIFEIDGAGHGLRALTAGNEYFWAPILSQDGSRMAFVSKIGGNIEIFVAGNQGQGRRAISNHPAADEHPSWFPDNQHLAFASNRDREWQIYRMDANGGNQFRLTYAGNDNRYLDVSPDGNQIAYVALGDSYPIIHLMLMDADGSNTRSLLTYSSHKQRDNTGSFVYRPDWSPDGRYIAFGADHDDDGAISIMVFDTFTGENRVIIRDGNGPAWSPDGKKIIYKPSGKKQIFFVADVQGNPLYQLTGSHYDAWSPDWGPR